MLTRALFDTRVFDVD